MPTSEQYATNSLYAKWLRNVRNPPRRTPAQQHFLDAVKGENMAMSDFGGARRAVLDVLRAHPGKWFKVQEICRALGNRFAETGISAYARDLRKEKYGSHNIRCEKVPGTDRTYAYFPPAPQRAAVQLDLQVHPNS